MSYEFERGRFNVHYLTAPYDLLVKAFGNDGTKVTRDDYKSMAQWDIETLHGLVEVYDYKVGKCYDSGVGLERHEITEWHVQGDSESIQYLLSLLDEVDEPAPRTIEIKVDPKAHEREPVDEAERLTWAALDTARAVLREYAVRIAIQGVRETFAQHGQEIPPDEVLFEEMRASGDPDAPSSHADLVPDSAEGDLALVSSFGAYLLQAVEDAKGAQEQELAIEDFMKGVLGL